MFLPLCTYYVSDTMQSDLLLSHLLPNHLVTLAFKVLVFSHILSSDRATLNNCLVHVRGTLPQTDQKAFLEEGDILPTL